MSWDELEFDTRVEVFREDQSLFLKPKDVTVATISKVFKVKSDSLFLEEDLTKNAEFPSEGRFKLPSSKYKVCGEAMEISSRDSLTMYSPHASMPGPSGIQRNWSAPCPWASDGRAVFTPKNKKVDMQPYESCMKRSFPVVTLTLDRTGKSILTDSTINNVYVKIPESSVAVPAILAEVAKKIGTDPEDLTLLDSKMLPVTDDKDLEYWKCPSRRLYISKQVEYEDVLREKEKGKRRAKKRRADSDVIFDECMDNESIQKIMEDIASIKDTMAAMKSASKRKIELDVITQLLPSLECKVCKDVPQPPVVLVLCCNQMIGCESCLQRSVDETGKCPLCRAPLPRSVPILGQEAVCSFLRQKLEPTD